MRTLSSCSWWSLLSACASAPPPPQPARLLADHLFAAPSERIGTDDVLKVSDAMRRYLAVDIADQIRTKGPQAGLVDALYRRAQLKLEYDAATHQDRRRGVRRPLRQLPVAGAHDGGAGARAQALGALPERLHGGGVEPQRQPAVRQRPRQHHARPAHRSTPARCATTARGRSTSCRPTRSAPCACATSTRARCWRCTPTTAPPRRWREASSTTPTPGRPRRCARTRRS